MLHTEEAEFQAMRETMVEEQLQRRGIADLAVLRAMRRVPRHEFVPLELRGEAYDDGPLPIGAGQTISQPYIVALMTAKLGLAGNEKVLEIGTGCGYQTAVLASLAREIFSVEFHNELGWAAKERLERLGIENVEVQIGDGSMGLPEHAPYDAILVAAAAPSVPEPLLQQLADGGRLIAPVGREEQQYLMLVKKNGDTFGFTRGDACRFVPLLGRYGWRTP